MLTTEEHIKISLKDFRPTNQKINLFDPNIQETSLRLFKIENSKWNKFKLYAFPSKIKIETAIQTSLLFSVNIPDFICFADKPLDNNNGIKIYSDRSNNNSVLDCINLIEKLILNLALEAKEGLFVYRNSIQLIVNHTRTVIPEILILQSMRSIIENKFPEPQTVDFSKIPEDLQSLTPILSEWAISDDLERNEKINQSSKTKLKQIIDLVNPKMGRINEYLSSFENESLPLEATLIGSLAELVAELTLHDE